MEIEVNILKGKLEEKGKHLRFQDSTQILDSILSSQMYPAIKSSLGFHETVKGVSSSRACTRILKANIMKSKIPIKEIRSQPVQHLKKMNFQKE